MQSMEKDEKSAKKKPPVNTLFQNRRLINEIKTILQIEPGMRNVVELRRLSSFLESCNIFKNIEDPVKARELCNCVKLVDFYEGEIICRQGDIGESFYIILEGSVNGYVDKKRGDGTAMVKGFTSQG